MHKAEQIIAQFTNRDKARFWEKIAVGKPDECWPWKGAKKRHGAQTKWKGLNIGPHALAYALNGGSFERGPITRHVGCRNPMCCNPSHLAAGTHKDNSDDRERDGMTARGAANGARKKAKLTDDAVREIRHLYENTAITQLALGKKFGVSATLIGMVVLRERWADVE